MTFVQIAVLALVQGLTEFLPVSSSAHLILAGQALGWLDQGLVFDVATHLGTLIAAIVYFRRDLGRMVQGILRRHAVQEDTHRRMAWMLLAASVPALVAGYFAAGWIGSQLRNPVIIAYSTLLFGVLLWVADRVGQQRIRFGGIRMRQALVIGLAQVLSLVPGTSRSGITITAGRFLGLDREAAARFSFLLSMPVIAAAGGYGALQVAGGQAGISWTAFIIALMLSAITAFICIWAFLALMRRISLLPFVIYRLALGLVILWALG